MHHNSLRPHQTPKNGLRIHQILEMHSFDRYSTVASQIQQLCFIPPLTPNWVPIRRRKIACYEPHHPSLTPRSENGLEAMKTGSSNRSRHLGPHESNKCSQRPQQRNFHPFTHKSEEWTGPKSPASTSCTYYNRQGVPLRCQTGPQSQQMQRQNPQTTVLAILTTVLSLFNISSILKIEPCAKVTGDFP